MRNIEKSAFRRGEYVGYANGVYKIRRDGYGGWVAVPTASAAIKTTAFGRTLRDISAALDAIAGQSVPRTI